MRRVYVALGVAPLGIAVGAFTLHIARAKPAYWFAGTSAAGSAALIGAGWALIGCGLVFWVRRPGGRFGPLLAASGFAWLLLEWNNPSIGSSLTFTIGLCLYAACPPLVGHAMLAFPGGRLGSWLERGAVAFAYVGGVVVLGLLPALFFDPQEQGCRECPRNLVLVADAPGAVVELNRVGVYLGLVWASALGVLLLSTLVRARKTSWRSVGPVRAAGVIYLGLVAAMFAASLDDGLLSNGVVEERLWLGQGAALTGIAAGVAWGFVRARRARSEVARLVVDLAQAPAPGGLRDLLAGMMGDPELELAYPLGEPERLVDAQGRSVVLSNRERTTLVRDGRPVAALAHAPGLLRDEQLVEDVTAAARLALDNERLQAEVRARLEELRASRARIVEASDAERKRLERDLHDGAQQRLVGLSLSLRLFRTRLPATAGPNVTDWLDQAETELRDAIAELRELAHGIFPAVLADEGFAAAVEALAEEARVPVRLHGLPEGRLEPPVESAAYAVVAEVARTATSGLDVRAERSLGAVAIEVETGGLTGGLDVVGLEDRVGALDGSLVIERRENGRVTIRAELPCGS